MTYQILRVDLTTGVCAKEDVPTQLISRLIGGKGLAAHYLISELPPGTDALSEQNLLIFMVGPLCGIFPGTCRHVIVTKSPATRGFLDTYAGGYFAWELRKAGLLGLIITGKARELSYLEITDASAVVSAAPELAGLSIAAVDDDARFKDYRVAAIGPAGENGCFMACVGSNSGKTKRGRSGYNARGGAGAVMGSKNLKAIAVRGTRGPKASEEAKELRKALSRRLTAPGSPTSWADPCGTPIIVDWANSGGVLPTRNWSRGSFDDAAALIGHEAVVRDLVAREGCYNCPVNCGPKVRASRGVFAGVEADKLEYETIGLGASNTGNGDFSAIVEFAAVCDELGLDTISTGAAVAFAMDCAGRGLIDHPIRFGDSEGQIALTRDIACKRGLGADLAGGVRDAALAWGVDETQVPVFHVKNLEFPAYDPRGSVGQALAYATSDRGGCHMRSCPVYTDALSGNSNADPFSPAGKANVVKGEQDQHTAAWCLLACHFVDYQAEDASTMLDTIGIELAPSEYAALGERVWNLVRLFNLREGWTAEDDRMPPALQIPLEDSGWALSPAVFEQMKAEYYRLREWTQDGRPTPDLISRLMLDEYATAIPRET